MPMYFPDLKSVQNIAEIMAKHDGEKEYTGLIPKSDKELPEARKQLGRYFRDVWKDNIQAAEIEYAVTEETYEAKMALSLFSQLGGLETK